MLTSALFLSVLQGNYVANSRACVPSGFNAWSLRAVQPLREHYGNVTWEQVPFSPPAKFPFFLSRSLRTSDTPRSSSFLPSLELSSSLWNFPPSATYVPEAQLYRIPPWMRLEHHDTDFGKVFESHVFQRVYLGTFVLRNASQ